MEVISAGKRDYGGKGRWVKYWARLGYWISPCYGPFSLGASFETYEQFISLIYNFFSGRDKPPILNQWIRRHDYICFWIHGHTEILCLAGPVFLVDIPHMCVCVFVCVCVCVCCVVWVSQLEPLFGFNYTDQTKQNWRGGACRVLFGRSRKFVHSFSWNASGEEIS
jgi:hypothetical protein